MRGEDQRERGRRPNIREPLVERNKPQRNQTSASRKGQKNRKRERENQKSMEKQTKVELVEERCAGVQAAAMSADAEGVTSRELVEDDRRRRAMNWTSRSSGCGVCSSTFSCSSSGLESTVMHIYCRESA